MPSAQGWNTVLEPCCGKSEPKFRNERNICRFRRAIELCMLQRVPENRSERCMSCLVEVKLLAWKKRSMKPYTFSANGDLDNDWRWTGSSETRLWSAAQPAETEPGDIGMVAAATHRGSSPRHHQAQFWWERATYQAFVYFFSYFKTKRTFRRFRQTFCFFRNGTCGILKVFCLFCCNNTDYHYCWWRSLGVAAEQARRYCSVFIPGASLRSDRANGQRRGQGRLESTKCWKCGRNDSIGWLVIIDCS